MKKFFIILTITGLLFSCSEDEINKYDVKGEKPTFYFQRDASYSYKPGTSILLKTEYSDSAFYSFAGVNIELTSLRVPFPIKIMGEADKPIKLKFQINEELTTAIEGTDFEINLDTLYVKPNEYKTDLIVNLLRTKKITKETLTIVIDLLETDEYSVLESYNNSDVWSSSNKVFEGKRFKYAFNEKLSEPWYWNTFGGSSLGVWTVKKFTLLNQLMKWTIADWSTAGMSGSKIVAGVSGYAAIQMQRYLQAQADEPINNPILDDDGSFMQLKGAYVVDYSRYNK